uniref:MIF4G domain-containing protein n=1 Tax=viral metagenome TaxID=1070528 RepID=A0A6C0LQJ5_9ZZZZ
MTNEAIVNKLIHPSLITAELILSLKNESTIPINFILTIPNIVIPKEYNSIKSISKKEELILDIRQIFNATTNGNVEKMKEKLREIVINKTTSSESLKDISDEIFECFLVSEQTIPSYMQLLNSVYNIKYKDESDNSQTIGQLFLSKCKKYIEIHSSDSEVSDEYTVRSIASLDQLNEMEFDKYNKSKTKIINLMIILCHLYRQNNTAFIKIGANHIHFIMSLFLTKHSFCQKRIGELGNPYEGEDCKDDNEFEIHYRMSHLYAEFFYILLEKNGHDFIKDQTSISVKDSDKKIQLSDLIERFKQEIVPKFSEAYLISKWEELNL